MGFQLINITGNLALYVNFWSLRVSLKSNTQKAKTMNGYLILFMPLQILKDTIIDIF